MSIDKFSFSRLLRPIHATETEEVVLGCQVVGKPTPVVQWCKDGFRLRDSPDFIITNVGGTCKLRICRSNKAVHSGTYLCRATNACGEATTSARVTLDHPEPPSILVPLRDLVVTIQDRAKLQVAYRVSQPNIPTVSEEVPHFHWVRRVCSLKSGVGSADWRKQGFGSTGFKVTGRGIVQIQE
ncbi:unnamed protein product [Protopolystoma xenopodis]|uniref:Ig-like domain-containing protein n=1 Tax=Protopolystoma xenopodis TaxID=117903 RepID=A0A3S5FC78_9PLAT|nr:unnamed protein product [Protopolystoma xenopodis]